MGRRTRNSVRLASARPGMPPPTPEEQAEYDAILARAKAKREKRRRKWAHARKMKALKWVREVEAYRKLSKSCPKFAETQSIHGNDHDISEIDRNLAAYVGGRLTLEKKDVKLDRGNGDPATPKEEA